MKDYGKAFEAEFRKSCEAQEVHVKRLKSRMTPYKNDNEVADFILYERPNMYYMELKSTKEKRLPFSMLRANQALGIENIVCKYDGIYGGIIFQYRGEDAYLHYFIPIKVLMKYLNEGNKSINLKEMELNVDIIPIEFKKKRVAVTLDIKKLIQEIRERNGEA